MPEWHQPFRLTATSVGFIGGRQGLTTDQLIVVRFLLSGFSVVELHHGDGLGADEEVHRLANDLRAWRIVHPGVGIPERAEFHRDAFFPPRPSTRRDRDLVDVSGALIVALTSAGDDHSVLADELADDLAHDQRATDALSYARSLAKTVVLVTPAGAEAWFGRR